MCEYFSREQTLSLLKQYNQNESSLKHALAVESVMKHFARYHEQSDVERWGNIGLIHDLDYERYPQEHCKKTKEILEKHQWPQQDIHAVLSHGYGMCTDVKPETTMEKVLYATDELTGLIIATTLMRPDRSLATLKPKSVIKKMKQKSFAASIDREVITQGAEWLDMDISLLIDETIKGLRPIAKEIGLND